MLPDIRKHRSGEGWKQTRLVNELILMAHVLFGVACIVASIWILSLPIILNAINAGL